MSDLTLYSGRAGGTYIKRPEHGMACWVYGDRKLAQKMAFAPEMLQALELVLATYGHNDDQAVADARAAVGNATGES